MAVWSNARKGLTKTLSKTGIGASDRPAHAKSNGNNSAQPQQPNDLAAYASQCNSVVRSTVEVHTQLTSIQALQRRALYSHASGDDTAREIENANTQVTAKHKALVSQLQTLRINPHARAPPYAAHLGLAERKVRDVIVRHMEIEREHRQNLRAAFARQYRVTRPDASDEEVRAACDENIGSQRVFAQALMHGEKRVSAAKNVRDAVGERHEAIVKAERQLVELAELFRLFGESVVEQGVLVQDIEKNAQTTNENLELATVDLSDATESARKARKKKWTCFWISVAIIIVVIAAIALIASLA